MSLTEMLLGGLGAALAAAGVLFKLWRGQAAKAKQATQQVKAEQAVRGHVQRVQAKADSAKLDTEQAVEEVRQEARKGRRDHFESDR